MTTVRDHRLSRREQRTRRLSMRARRTRALAVIIALGIIVAGVVDGGWGKERSAEPAAQAFLLAWQQRDYRTAASYTTGRPSTVAGALAGLVRDVDATALFLTMGGIVQHGDTAVAHFSASVDVGQEGHEWSYDGRFLLRRSGSGWKVEWGPRVVNPNLGPGDRLAVVTKVPPRAPILDAAGKPLQASAPVYVVGVRPASLARPAVTAAALARLTGLAASQLLGQIQASPPAEFLKLLSLDPRSYARLRVGLRKVPGVRVVAIRERLFASAASGIVGTVGTEDASVLRDAGQPYQPGTTVGLTGLEAAYQRTLAGTPTTEVVVDDAAGRQVAVLRSWPGTSSAPVRTTIDAGVQAAAQHTLATVPDAAAQIVAVQPSTGDILAVAGRSAPGARLPSGDALDERVEPGDVFTIVSTAALLGTGFSTHSVIPCPSVADVGGRTFTSTKDAADLGTPTPFSADFADGCGTAFAGLSRRLTAAGFEQTVRGFGIGSRWQFPLPAFSGSVPTAANDGQLAAETIGRGIQVSPLAMALAAAEVESGVSRTPVLVADPHDASNAHQTPLTSAGLRSLRDLMRAAVTSGSASAADVPGAPVYGQTALFRTGTGHGSAWQSWFVGYRGDLAFAVLESGPSSAISASALAARFLAALPSSR